MHFCPDLVYLVEVFSRFCSNLRPIHIELVKHILHYIFGTLYLGLTFDEEANTPDDMIGYIYSNFAESKSD